MILITILTRGNLEGMKKPVLAFALSSAAVLALAGCSSSTPSADSGESSAASDGAIQVVASTNVWGDIVSEVGGDHVDVTSIIASLAQDPHEYEDSAEDQLTVKDAQLIVENGGGYDAFIESLRESSDSEAPVITAVEYASTFTGGEGNGEEEIEGFNEHVWYDVDTVSKVAEEIATELSDLDAANKDDYAANLASFQEKLDGLSDSLADLKTTHEGEKIFVTEPVPLYLTEAAGLVNATPSEFSEAVEEGQDVPPATLLEATDILNAGDVKILFANAQTGGAETTQVIDVANTQGIPVQEVTELVPDGDDYISWMQDNIATLASNLDK